MQEAFLIIWKKAVLFCLAGGRFQPTGGMDLKGILPAPVPQQNTANPHNAAPDEHNQKT